MTRLLAAVCLVAMFGSWAPHGHQEGHAHGDGHVSAHALAGDLAHAVTISADDAHEEHSSRSTATETGCAVCRSKDDRKGDRARVHAPLPATDPGVRLAAGRLVLLPTSCAHRLHPTRAPPIA